MPRNASGVHTFLDGNPTAGTVISEVVEGRRLDDIEAEFTDSLSRTGKGEMLAPLRTTDGSSSSPAHSFTNETSTGVYRAGSNDVRVTVGGTDRGKWTASGFFADVVTALTAIGTTIKGAVADGASAVAAIIDNTITLSTTGAKLLSIRNNTTEKAYFTKDGALYCGATETGTITAGTGWQNTGNGWLRRSGGLAVVRIEIEATSGTPETTPSAIIESGYRPAVTCYAFGTLVTSGVYYVVQVSTNTAGYINIGSIVDSNGQLEGSATFAIGSQLNIQFAYPCI